MSAPWLKYLPAPIRARIEHRPHLLMAISNTGWLFGDKIIRMGVGLVVGVWMARYLGPEQFGLLNYAMAFVALFGAIASLGLNGIVVRDLVKEPQTADTTLGTAFLLQITGGFAAFGICVLAISFARPDDGLAKLMVAVLGFVMVFKSTEVMKYWFESQVQSKYAVWVENGAFLIFAAVKVALILGQASLMAFVWAAFAEGLLASIGVVWAYGLRGGRMTAWRGQLGCAKALLKESWPLILSGLAIMVYMRIDQIMLGQMLGNEAVGIYSAAVRISEVWYFIPMAIVASAFPSIVEAKKRNESIYHQRLQRLYELMVLLSLSVALPVSFLSEWLVNILFGRQYEGAAPVVSISVWAGVAVALSIVHGKWLLTEGLQKYALLYTLSGALINVAMNWYLIPVHGVEGAAWATLCAQVAPIFFQLFIPKARKNFALMLRALMFPFPWRISEND
jgi:PST family polysaccharide transporter